ncbi:MAG: hypothetical protein DA408_10515 [Bacteroidetes bacterium]|nr:MAG: hypothetical protein C7N36_07575 [Bacteroidota bacterium]PTM12488.1 MAG: hypothetical protein DA408_10515 [Bacteroidota bacterium]
MEEWPQLLSRQLQRTIGTTENIPAQWKELLLLVNATYQQYDHDRLLAEQAMALSSDQFVKKNKALEEASRQLSRSNQELEKFAYVVAHDLREPLRAIASFTQLLGRRLTGKLEPETEEFMDYIVGNVNHMERLLEDTMNFSRLRTNDQLEEENVATNALVEHILNNYQDLPAKNKPLFFIETPLPNLRINAIRMRQVWQNLISNAIKYNDADVPEIRIGCQQTAELVTFSICDNGPGIPPDYAEKVFELFTTLQNKFESNSSGIGLAICKKIIEDYGETIWVDTQITKGACIRFALPRSRVVTT